MNAATLYQQAGPTNVYQGRQAVRIIATYINWKALGEDPAVIAENSVRIKARIHLDDTVSNEPIAIVGFGPSLKDTIGELKHFNIIFRDIFTN